MDSQQKVVHIGQTMHLTTAQLDEICQLFALYLKLFSNQLRSYPHHKIPWHFCPHSVARAHIELFRKEIDRFVSIGVLRPCGATEWASPTMVIPKKDETVCVVSDFRKLNKVIRQRVYPLLPIQDMHNCQTGY